MTAADRNARARAKAEAITMPFFGPVTPGGWQHELIIAITAALEFAGEETEAAERELTEVKRLAANRDLALQETAACLYEAERERDEMRAELLRVRGLIDRDRTGLAAGLDAVRARARAGRWISEGRGSYSWNDDRYREETGHLVADIVKLADDALRASGTLANEAFHPPDARRASPTASEAREQPVCRRICVLAVQGGDRDGPHDLDYCDLWEASEIGTPCAGLCHGDPRQPFDGICPRCGTHGNDGESCKVCEPPTASEVQQSREGAAARAELSRVSAEGAGGPPPPLSEVKCDGSGWISFGDGTKGPCPGCTECRKERP